MRIGLVRDENRARRQQDSTLSGTKPILLKINDLKSHAFEPKARAYIRI